MRVGPFTSASEANAAAARVQALGLDAVAAAVE
ncbi:SPOR domain-containing protein [Melaminivora alkalimesophila]